MTEAVDLKNLQEVLGGDKELEREMFAEYIRSSTVLLDDMEAHCRNGVDNEDWSKTAHALKGLSINLGALPLATLCAAAQDDSEAPSATKLEHLKKIHKEYEKVRCFLESGNS